MPQQPDAIIETDVVIVGAGPIGIELAVAFKQAGVDYLQVEAGSVGSTMAWWAPATLFFSSPERIEIAGVPLTTVDQSKATREQYLAYLRGVARQFDLDVRTGTRVHRIEQFGGGFQLALHRSYGGVGGATEAAAAPPPRACPSERLIRCRRVVLAIGNMHRPRLLNIPGEDRPHVSHYFRDPHHYFGGSTLIVGGKNSAVEAALRLYRCGVDVTISYRGNEFDRRRIKYWLLPEINWLIEKGRIGWRPYTTPREIFDDHVVLAPSNGGTDVNVDADFVLLLTGYVQDADLFEQLALERTGDEQTPVVDTATMESSVPDVFIAGTAMGGSQHRTRVFIENAHVHVDRIVRHLTGTAPAWSASEDYASLEES